MGNRSLSRLFVILNGNSDQAKESLSLRLVGGFLSSEIVVFQDFFLSYGYAGIYGRFCY